MTTMRDNILENCPETFLRELVDFIDEVEIEFTKLQGLLEAFPPDDYLMYNEALELVEKMNKELY